ncbi:hypothetical protein [Mycoplasmopsis pullorum]|uniref:hypothetical protein n=1 Tax=Mycoplasmopsis pullorum TaxID=48003 RepID=UPI001118AFAC|nr:hypothetical protein [Mycoplasmopsis pullorum]TNK83479.1 hypothetical protein C4M93_02295 [Mycoplasmopsis pullorum]TNK88774.1 hypothetical protein C4M89_01480 [Mycoplasmopsis pullorum]TNK92373.1 hypothetical protein C4M96_01125 [Mycoplasmopsis pullorum]
MNIQEAKEIFLNVLNSTPGIAEIHPIHGSVSIENDDVKEKEIDILDMLVVEEVNKCWEFKCRVNILHGISAKQLINGIYKQLSFVLKKHDISKFNLRVYVKGVSYE